ncbi:hypothetical protein BU25DRAFT_494050 [Macroventuria anomochaeta]|uniref:Uncharacterized protein n=1 Tax=Macroventuria anomochaeta TaxID=301207 RepID=A0ACB6RRW8_9PLEO|nr:uncharacterized protein BU25DRAFT_494050 [Macroventuria anomochaeta]KAF2623888.1 hypothetical protein BU25DRAFT_494050 [Macroventuria anomochaeta]
MAHVVAVTGMLESFKGDPLYPFVVALINAFHESVTKQNDFEYKQRFSLDLGLRVIRLHLLGQEGTRSRGIGQKLGAQWAMHYVMYLERIGKTIEVDDKRIEADYLLKTNLLVQHFASGDLDADADRAAESAFAEPRIQALLRDAPPVQKCPNNTKKEDMWLDPDEALEMLRETEMVRKAMKEEEEKKMQKALQDMAGLSISSITLGQ